MGHASAFSPCLTVNDLEKETRGKVTLAELQLPGERGSLWELTPLSGCWWPLMPPGACAGEACLSVGPPNRGSTPAPQNTGSSAGIAKGWCNPSARAWAGHPGQRVCSQRSLQRDLYEWIANWEQSSGGGKCEERCKRSMNYVCWKGKPVKAASLRGPCCPRWPWTRVNTLALVTLNFSSRNMSCYSNGLVKPPCTVRSTHKPAWRDQRRQMLLRSCECCLSRDWNHPNQQAIILLAALHVFDTAQSASTFSRGGHNTNSFFPVGHKHLFCHSN